MVADSRRRKDEGLTTPKCIAGLVSPPHRSQRAPIRILLPRVLSPFQNLTRFVGRFGLVLVLTAATLLLPRPDGLSPDGHRAIAAFVFTATILGLQPVSLPIAALMVPLSLVALGVADANQAFETFSRPVVFLILGSLFLAEALRKHGLTRRLALHAIRLAHGSTSRLLLALMLLTAGLSMWIENTATAAMLIPVAITIASQVQDRAQSQRLLILLVLGIAYAASIGGMVTITGSSANAVASSHLAQTRTWTFLDWMAFGVPSFLVIFPLTWLLLKRLHRTGIPHVDAEPALKQLAEIGPLKGAEKELLATLAVAIVLWIAGPQIESLFGLPTSLLSAALVAIIAVSYLAVREIIAWDDLKGVSWGIFLIIGAGLALGEAVVRTGVADWVADNAAPVVAQAPVLVALLVLTFASALLTNVLNNTTIAAVLVPVLLRIAEQSTLNPLYLVMPATLATTFGYSLPSASGRMALIAATGILPPATMFRTGMIMMTASALALALLFYVLEWMGWS